MSVQPEPAWAVVPVKCFDRGKSRLASVLPAAERTAFARHLFDHVASVLMAARRLSGVLIATDCTMVADEASARGALVRMDSSPVRLSDVIDAALDDVAARGARSALVVMADLPRIAVDDVRALLNRLADADVVIASDVRGRHTNALALRLPRRFATCFGAANSFVDHRRAALAAALRVETMVNERIAFDVDEPADHARALK